MAALQIQPASGRNSNLSQNENSVFSRSRASLCRSQEGSAVFLFIRRGEISYDSLPVRLRPLLRRMP